MRRLLAVVFLFLLTHGSAWAQMPPPPYDPLEALRARLWSGGRPAVDATEARHHGAVSASRGAGSPIETNSPLSLPEGYLLGFLRNEYVPFRRAGAANPTNKASFDFLSGGVAYGITPSVTATLAFPYPIKSQDTLGQTAGFGDIKVGVSVGFNYNAGKGLQFNNVDDTAVSLEGNRKTYLAGFVLFGFPNGSWQRPLFSPDMQSGHGSFSYSVGLAATREIGLGTSLTLDTMVDVFTTRPDHFKFGTEFRVNAAVVSELFGDKNPKALLRKIDGILEVNYLKLGRDRVDGIPELASGGSVIYVSPGVRFQLGDTSLGLLVKVPAIKGLNEGADQQGSEGLEWGRFILTLSRNI